ncbi:MAG: tetratricopeptide repeat protein [Shimia thalassica]|uniref:tetratricopeptide repeat protein n=1 Tax=Shimia thalassica TaxID=1715693 RepID=UPI0032998619
MNTEHLNLALTRGDWPLAAALLAPLTRGQNAHPSLLYNHGKVLVELGHHCEAMQLFHRCVARAPGHAAAWFEMGRTALSLEELETGFDAFSKVVSLDKTDMDAARNLGRIAIRLGHWQAAERSWSLLKGDPEADLALYRVAAETRNPKAAEMRKSLLETHPDRAAVLRTLVRVSKGAMPLNL